LGSHWRAPEGGNIFAGDEIEVDGCTNMPFVLLAVLHESHTATPPSSSSPSSTAAALHSATGGRGSVGDDGDVITPVTALRTLFCLYPSNAIRSATASRNVNHNPHVFKPLIVEQSRVSKYHKIGLKDRTSM
jgi:hypothetical protein